MSRPAGSRLSAFLRKGPTPTPGRTAARRTPVADSHAGAESYDVLGNSAFTQRLSAPVLQSVDLRFDEQRPWLVRVPVDSDLRDVAWTLYGDDFAFLLEEQQRAWSQDPPGADQCFEIVPELLGATVAGSFRSAVEARLLSDVAWVEAKLLEARIGGEEEGLLVRVVRRWSETRDMRGPDGRTYFDCFLHSLVNDRWRTDYLITQSESRSYLDLLLEETEERSGEVQALIAAGSREFGGYRPAWAAYDMSGAPAPPTADTVNPALVSRTSRSILDFLEGITDEGHSRAIADAMLGLPAAEDQAEVLREIMRHYGDADATGIFGKYGEAWEGGMLYWLFEDLTEADRTRLAADLVAKGTLPESTVQALLGGRGWGGKYLPYTTYKAQEATEFYADMAVHETGAESVAGHVGGFFSSLWLPETAGATIRALTLARVAQPGGVGQWALGLLPEKVAVGATLLATGLGAYQTTIEVQRAVSGTDPYTGRTLDPEERVASVLLSVSGTLFLAAGFLQATAQTGTQSQGTIGPNLASEGTTWRLVGVDAKSGYATAVGTNLADGQVAVVRLNMATGEGSAINLSSGGSVAIRGWRLVASPRLITGAGPSAAVVPVEVPGTALAATPLSNAALASAEGGPAWQALAPATVAAPMLDVGEFPAGTLGAELSGDSLLALERTYGRQVRDAVASTWVVAPDAIPLADLEAIAQTLPSGLSQQFKGDMGEYLKRDAAPREGRWVAPSHGRSNMPGPDVTSLSLSGAPRIVLGEVKLGTSPSPYRIGATDLPAMHRQPAEVYEYLYRIIRNRALPPVIRARLKAAMDDGRIEWQLTGYGNVRLRVRGKDPFPGDVEFVTPFVIRGH